MAELVDELDSAHMLAFAEAKKLLGLKPDHELLKYFIMPEEDVIDGKPDPAKHAATQAEMKDRFWDQEKPWREESGMLVMTVVLFNYYRTVKEVNKALASTVPK